MDYVICASPRTGSNLLKSGLARTERAGTPEEAFGDVAIAQRGFPTGSLLDVERYVARLREELTGANGLFGFKIHFHQAEKNFFARGHALEDLLRSPRFIRIVREDRVSQAVSWARAKQTGIYYSGQPAAEGRVERYDFLAICVSFIEVMREESGWQEYFECRNIRPLEIHYETLSERYAETLLRVLEYLGIDGPDRIEIQPPRLRRQRDARTAGWVERFHSDLDAALQGAPIEVTAGQLPEAVHVVQIAAKLMADYMWSIERCADSVRLLRSLRDHIGACHRPAP